MPTGPCEQPENGSQQGPEFRFASTYSECKLKVLGRGRILVECTVNNQREKKIYERVWGFIVKSKNTSTPGPLRDFEIKIVFVPELNNMNVIAKTTKIIWNPDSPSVDPGTRTVRIGFIRWVEEHGLDIIDDLY